MSYLDQSEIAFSGAMFQRIAQCAAQQGEADADTWIAASRRTWAAAPGWDEAWAYAKNVHQEAEYDPGADEAVITDQMILSQVQLMLQEATPRT